MFKDSLIINSINKILGCIQDKCSYLWENSLFLQNIDNLIFASILMVFVFSMSASSDVIGYVALVTFFLTLIKLFLKKGEKIEGNLFEFFLLTYFIIVVISLCGSTLFHLSLKGFLKTFTYLSFYFSAVQYFKNNLPKIPFTILTIAACVSVESIVGIFQNFSQVGEISTWQDVSSINPEDVMTRVYGTLLPYNPNLFGGYLVAGIPCIFGGSMLNFADKKWKSGLLWLAFALLSSFTLILTGCRGAYVALMAIFLGVFILLAKFIWFDLENKKEFFKKIYISFLSAMAAFSAFLVFFVSSIRTRVLSIFAMRADSSTSFRFNVYQSTFEMAKDNWLLGIGVGNQNFREIYGLYMKTGFDALSAYCVFLEIAVESGVFALIAFLMFLAVFGFKSIKYIIENKDLKSGIVVSTSLIGVVALMTHGLVDTVFFRPQIQFVFWILVAFVSAYLYGEKKTLDC